jgi:hypothetical protein
METSMAPAHAGDAMISAKARKRIEFPTQIRKAIQEVSIFNP